jgi:WS/DGAT/MGAT family acyltransferase
MVPVSVQDDDEGGRAGNRVSSYIVDLPVGEPSPVMRLHQVSYRMKAHKETGQAVGAESLVGLAGFAPPTLHALGARAASSMSKRWFNLVVTNVPGPQVPLYCLGARMLEAFPMVPLSRNLSLGVAILSYCGVLHFGLFADADAWPDLDDLAADVEAAFVSLRHAVGTPDDEVPVHPSMGEGAVG